MTNMFIKYDNLPEGYIPTNTYWPKTQCTEPVARLLTNKIDSDADNEIVFRLSKIATEELVDKDIKLTLTNFRGEFVKEFTTVPERELVKYVVTKEDMKEIPQEVYYLRLETVIDNKTSVLFNSTVQTLLTL